MAPKKAKCPENQAAVDRLLEKKDAAEGKDRYCMTLKRAIDSLSKATEPIVTYKQALQLKYVGDHCARIICPISKRSRVEASDDCSVGSAAAAPSTKRTKAKPPPKSSLETIGEEKSAKQRTYEKAIQSADEWKRYPDIQWKVVLIIDGREPKSEHVIAKCRMSGIPCEERNLPVGDMAWLARGTQQRDGVEVVELMLGTVIERKTPGDLRSSIIGSRYQEQRLRLKHCGLPQVLFLVEGDIREDPKCTEMLHTAIWETSLHLGFQTVQTEHLEGTVRTLKRMHRRILQRSFPQAFKGDLPIFLEAMTANRPASGRRRVQSLAEMTFEQEPSLCFGMKRFITYEELKAKVEMDREAGTKTLAGIHLAMLKQISTFSDKKCKAIAQKYPTPHALFSAYARVSDSEAKTLVADLSTRDPLRSQRESTIGPKSSNELYSVYGFNNNVQVRSPNPPATTVKESAANTIPKPTRTNKPSATLVASIPLARKENMLQSVLSSDSMDDDLREGIKRSLEDHETGSFSPPPSSASISEPTNAVARKQHTKSSTERARSCLNTSIGSLLDSDSDDDQPSFRPRKTPEVIEID